MKRILLTVVTLAILAAAGLGAVLYMRTQRQHAAADAAAVERLQQDVGAVSVMRDLRAAAATGRVAIVNVNVIGPIAGVVVPAQTVISNGETIEWVGASTQAPSLAGATVIDGAGRYLSPGLTDMHVHTEHLGQHLLRLAAGVTSVRDMDGFPWLLRTRDAINSGAMIGATTYVAGTIIADHALDGYAVVVHTPDEARRVVRNQAACGYSFIKVHNRLAQPLFDAVADEAQRVHLDLVGHVPHGISLAHAIQSGHMRTLEHLKGFLHDETLLPSDEPYAPALNGADVWLTPTLYTRLGLEHGEAAHQLGADPRQRFTPRGRRGDWIANAPAEGSPEANSYERLIETQRIVMGRLLPLHPRWLVGTDAAGYPFNIAGYATLDELVLLRQAGLSNPEVVRAATSEPAIAMRRPTEFGRIAPGMRADWVLLAANPLADVAAYQNNLGVMARGRWYSRAGLDAALDALARVYAEETPPLSAARANALSEAAARAAQQGYVFEDNALGAAATAFDRAGQHEAARRLRALTPVARDVCQAETPS
jgi:hypothetical protein